MESITISMGEMFISLPTLAEFHKHGKNPMFAFRLHAEAAEAVIDPAPSNGNAAKLVRGQSVVYSFAMQTGEQVCIVTEADRSRTMVMLQTEFDAGHSGKVLQMHAKTPRDQWQEDARQVQSKLMSTEQASHTGIALLNPNGRLVIMKPKSDGTPVKSFRGEAVQKAINM